MSALLGRLSLALLEAWLGPLPTASDLVLWAFVVASSVAAVSLAAWSRRSLGGQGFAFGLLVGYWAMLIAGALTVVMFVGLFYGSGVYEKGGYGRLMAGLLVLLFNTTAGLVVAARVVGGAMTKSAWRIASTVGLWILGFLIALLVLPAIFASASMRPS